MNNKQIAKAARDLYHLFCKEHNVTPGTMYANILWLWPEYLKTHKTW